MIDWGFYVRLAVAEWWRTVIVIVAVGIVGSYLIWGPFR